MLTSLRFLVFFCSSFYCGNTQIISHRNKHKLDLQSQAKVVTKHLDLTNSYGRFILILLMNVSSVNTNTILRHLVEVQVHQILILLKVFDKD